MSSQNSQKIETAQMFIVGWMGKHSMICTYGRILFSLVKEGDSDKSYIDEFWIYAEWNKPVTKGNILYNSTSVSLFHRDRKNGDFSGLREGEKGS